MTLTALIDEIERATEGSPDLDGRICRALGAFAVECDDEDLWGWVKWKADSELESLPWYTTSLDAALTLVHGLWTLACEDRGPYVRILPARADGSFIGQRYVEARAHTPALALTAAALRARKEMNNG